jgi:valacyclovir hydrolase
VQIHYEESGQGEPVLVMPGWAGTVDELMPLRQALEGRYRVVAADVPGSGKSGPQPRSYPATYYHDDARTMLALMQAVDASPAHLIGFSDGGEYALVMAAIDPTAVKSVVTWGSAGKLPDAPELAHAMATAIDEPMPPMQEFAEYMKATYGEANARAMSQSFSAALLAIMRSGGDISRSRAGDIACPALLIAGEHDFVAPPQLVAEMANAIPNAEFIEVTGASHAVHHEQGEWLVAKITDWLAQH